MKIRCLMKVFLMSVIAVMGSVAVRTAEAVPFNQCPNIGSNTGCAILIEWNGGNFTSALDPTQGPYIDTTQSGDDTLIGLQNSSTDKSLSFITLSDTSLFAFDHDGLNAYGYTPPDTSIFPNNYTMTGYEGPISYFTVSNNNGQVNFIGGIAPGASTYFALEGAPNAICPSPNNECVSIATGDGTIPEPGTILLLGTGLAGLSFARLRKT